MARGAPGILTALTTIFRPPCPTTWLIATTKAPSQYPPFPAAGPSSCDPPFWNYNIAGEAFLQYYSPALCPSGFSVGPGCSITGRTRTAEGFASVGSGETAVWCVPRGFSCTSDITDFRGGIWGVAGAGAAITVGPALQIRWRDVDLTSLETHPLSPGVVVGKGTVPITDGILFTIGPAPTISVAPPSIPTTAPPRKTGGGGAYPPTLVPAPLPSSTSSTAGSRATNGSNDNGNSSSSPVVNTNSRAVVAAISVLSVLLFLLILGLLAVLFLRRYRRRHAGRLDGLFPVGTGAWIVRRRRRAHVARLPDHAAEPDVETPLPTPIRAAVVRLPPADFGEELNPAELYGGPVLLVDPASGPATPSRRQAQPRRGSEKTLAGTGTGTGWRARMSRMVMSMASWAAFLAAPASSKGSSRRALTSRGTGRTEMTEAGSNATLGLQPPGAVQGRISRGRTVWDNELGSLPSSRSGLSRSVELERSAGFERLSEGTFGRNGSHGSGRRTVSSV